MPDQVPAAIAAERRDRLVEVAEAVAEEATLSFVGRRLSVLVEEVEDGASSAQAAGGGSATAIGRSYREAPETDGEVRLPGCDIPVGRVLDVEITEAAGLDLIGRPVGVAEPALLASGAAE
jgi:ribosomal protein S12 methylthiotransferase